MQNRSLLRSLRLDHRGVVTFGLFVLLLAGYFGVLAAAAQVTVLLAPVPQLQFFDQSGRPLSFGCVFTYQNNSVTPLATYTDSTGTTQNQNPVILSAGGSANIWIQAGVAYSFRLKTSGGTQCASGSTLYTVNGIGGGVSTLTTIVTFSSTPLFVDSAQNQLFQITLTGNASSQPLTAVGVVSPGLVTWQITQDGSGGHTFSWPANEIGGCPIGMAANQITLQHSVWNGVNAIATGPCVIGLGPAISTGSIVSNSTITGPTFVSACANPASAGVFRLCQTDAILWRNVANSADEGLSTNSADQLTVSHPNGIALAGATPNLAFGGVTASFPAWYFAGTTLQARLADNSADAALSAGGATFSAPITSTPTTFALLGPAVSTPGTPPASGKQQGYFKASKGWCAQDSSSNEYCTAAGSGVVGQHHYFVSLGANVILSGGTPSTILTQAVTMPSAGCPCRVILNYQIYILGNTNGSAYDAWVADGTSSWASSQTYMDATNRTGGFGASAISENTYANGASVTFTLKAEDNVGNTIAKLPSAGAPQNTWMTVDVISSN